MMPRMAQGRLGRPPVPGAPHTKAKLGPEDRALLEAVVRAENRTITDVVTDAVRLYAGVHHRSIPVEPVEAQTAA